MLSFRVFGFPLHIHLTFAILLLFVLDSGLTGIGIVLWVLAIFLSVVLHELGHAATVRRFGGHVDGITIYALGGVTVWREAGIPIRGWKRFVVAAAGSGVGLFAGLGLFAFARLGGFGEKGLLAIPTPWSTTFFGADRPGWYLVFFVGAFIWVSVVWGLVNWLPIGGLDGSKMLREVLIKVLGPRGDLHSRIIGVIVGLVAAYWFWQRGLTIAAFLFLMFSVSDLAGYRRPPQLPSTGVSPATGSAESDDFDAPLDD